MKKVLITLVLACFILSSATFVAAQRFPGLRKLPKAEKVGVKYNKIQAFSDGRGGVWLEWETGSESNNLGFSVYRVGGDTGKKIDERFTPGAYLKTGEAASAGGKYTFFDEGGDLSSAYYIESLSASGKTHASSIVAPGYVEDLSQLTGISAGALKYSAKTASPTFIKDENVLPSDLRFETQTTTAQSDPAQQFAVASQPGVKFGIKKEGIYRVARAQLSANGFDVSAAPELWQLYAGGVEQAINVGGAGDYVEFYGRGIDTLEANVQTYFLTVGTTAGKRIRKAPRRAAFGRTIGSNYAQSVLKKDRLIYINSVLNGEQENFFGAIVNATDRAVNINLTGIDFKSAKTRVDVGVQGLTLVAHKTLITINNTEIGTVSGNLRDLAKGTFEIPTSLLIEGANVVKFKAVNGTSDVSLIESVKFTYNRKFQAQQNSLSFYTNNQRAVNLENFTSPNVRVFDVTNPENPIHFANLTAKAANGGFSVFLPAGRGRVMFAVEDSAILVPDSISQNYPSDWSKAIHNANLIVITHKNWTEQSNEWAKYRRAQGLSVVVVDVEDVYDEFNFGINGSSAINNFLRHASATWNTKPTYVLLIGDATYDPKNNAGGGANNFIPTKLVDTVYTETGSDDALADFNDDGLAEMAIGRLPVRDAQTVTKLLGKVTAFEQTASTGLSRGVIFASDEPNGYDFEALSQRVRNQLPQTVNAVMISRTQADARTKLLSEINNGRFLVNYSGHGTATAWVNDGFLGKNDFTGNQTASPAKSPTITNTNLSIFTMLTCLNGYFISVDQTAASDGLAESMLKESNGAVASWASSGLTTPDVQEIMATRFYGQLGAGNFARLGDLIKDAKTSIDGGRDVRLSWVLLGDPTLKVK